MVYTSSGFLSHWLLSSLPESRLFGFLLWLLGLLGIGLLDLLNHLWLLGHRLEGHAFLYSAQMSVGGAIAVLAAIITHYLGAADMKGFRVRNICTNGQLSNRELEDRMEN